MDAEVLAAAKAFLRSGSMRDALQAAANARSDLVGSGLAKQDRPHVVGYSVYVPPLDANGKGHWSLHDNEQSAASFAAYLGSFYQPLVLLKNSTK